MLVEGRRRAHGGRDAASTPDRDAQRAPALPLHEPAEIRATRNARRSGEFALRGSRFGLGAGGIRAIGDLPGTTGESNTAAASNRQNPHEFD
jgi:hypothetical protein